MKLVGDFSRHHPADTEMLRALVENSPNMILIIDRECTIEYINYTIEGMTIDEVLGTKSYVYLPIETRSRYFESISQVFDEQRPATCEFPSIAETRWQMRLVPLRNSDGTVDRALGILTNVTQLARAEMLVRDSELLAHQIFDAAPTAMAALNADGNFLYWNREMQQSLGYLPDEIARLNIADVVHREDAAIAWNAVRELTLGNADRQRLSLRYIRKDSRAIWARVVASPVTTQDGKVQLIILTAEAIGVEDDARQLLTEQTSQLREAQAIARVGSYRWHRASNHFEGTEELHRLFGFSARDIQASFEALLQKVHPPDREILSNLFHHLPDTRESFEEEIRIIHSSGEIRWVLTKARPVTGTSGGVVGTEGTFQDINDRKRNELLLEAERSALELLASNAPLEEVLHAMTQSIEAQSPEMLCSIMFFDESTHRLTKGAAPSLPSEYVSAIDGIVVDAATGSCGAAVCQRQTIVIGDIATHPYWRQYKHVALQHGLKSCWSMPVFSSRRKPIAVFGVYYRQCRTPTPFERTLVERAVYVAGIAIDQRHAEQIIRDNEARFRQFADAVPFIIWTHRVGSSQLEFVSAAYEPVFGRSREDLQVDPQTWVKSIHADDRKKLLASLAMPTAEVEPVEYRITRPDDSVRWLRSQIVPLQGEGFGPQVRVGVTEDITLQKEVEEESAHRQATLAQVSRLTMLGELVAGITHEITQPLTAIANFAGVANAILEQEPSANVELHEYVREISTQATRAGKIVHSLRSLARQAASRRESLLIPDLLEESLNLLRTDMRRDGYTATVDAPSGLRVHVDKVQLQQVVINLVRNACEAMQSNPADKRHLHIAAREVDNRVHIRFADEGVGLPPDIRPRLFQSFFTTKPSGMGMGLPICRTILESHGGRIFAEANVPCGAVFCVTLPADPLESFVESP